MRTACPHLSSQHPYSPDEPYFPPQIADNFVRDDQLVMQSGRPLINRIEIWYDDQHILDWFTTNKFPVWDRRGQVMGVMGTVQSYEGKQNLLLPYAEIREAVNYIRTHYCKRIPVSELAERTHLSERQLHRKFRNVFGMNVRQFVIKTRIQAIGNALTNSDASLAEIAADFGFCDQSAFTQQFRKYTGMTPLRYRRRYSP